MPACFLDDGEHWNGGQYLNPLARLDESDMVEKKKFATFRSSSDSQSWERNGEKGRRNTKRTVQKRVPGQ